MADLPFIFALAMLVAAALATIGIWAPRRLAPKLAAIGLAAAFAPLGYLGFVDLLSRPKPVGLEWWQAQAAEATVLGSHIREGDGVYLWLQLTGAVEPRSYRLPWDADTAQELVDALREAEEKGAGVRMKLPFEPTFDQREPRFYATPQPALPDKDTGRAAGPKVYQRPGQDA